MPEVKACPPRVQSNENRAIERKCWMIVIGADTHKSTHAFAAVDANTGQLRAMRQTARVRVARKQVKRIGTLTREAETLKREL